MRFNFVIVDSRKTDIENLFRQVIDLDFYRILSRLRSRHAIKTLKTAGKPTLVALLNRALNDGSTKASSGASDQELSSLKYNAGVLHQLFIQLEEISDLAAKRNKACKLVGEIVKQAHEIRVSRSLIAAFQPSQLDPSLKAYLPEAIGKVGRYYSATSELVCAARDKTSRVFQNIRVEPFYIKIPLSIKKQELKVHAEIQILFFYEIHLDRLRPRTICSSKSACFLCNLFFDLHSGFYIPRTHGRLYDKWVLPDWIDISMDRRRELCLVLARFKATLDDKIARVSSSKKCYLPNESVLPPLGHWPSSSALSGYTTPSHASESTVRPNYPLAAAGSLRSGSDLTQPRTPPGPPPFALANTEVERKNCINGIVFVKDHKTGSLSNLSAVSTVTISYKELPYTQPIVLTTPLLYLQLDKLLLILDFVQVASGKLSVVQERSTCFTKDYQVVNIKEIPTTTDMRLDCSQSSNKLEVQLLTASGTGVFIIFEWEE
jgi:hypothetical protein